MKLLNKEIICCFDGYNIKDNYDTCISSYQDDKTFSQNKFEILSEEDEEIDIEAINEFGTNGHEGYISYSPTDSEKEKELRKYIVNNIKDIKILIKAVKQLNKKLEEK